MTLSFGKIAICDQGPISTNNSSVALTVDNKVYIDNVDCIRHIATLSVGNTTG